MVLTLTVTIAAVPGVTFTVDGTMHVASCGAPSQVKEMVCCAPMALSCKEKLAVWPHYSWR